MSRLEKWKARARTLKRVERRRRKQVQKARREEYRAKADAGQVDELAATSSRERAEERLRSTRSALVRATKAVKKLSGTDVEVVSRAQWGAAKVRGTLKRNVTLTKGVQHHTADPGPKSTATVAEESAYLRRVQQGHFARGFSDIGYHLIVMPSGRIYEGRAAWAVGAHTAGNNTGTFGISCAGNFENQIPTKAALDSVRLIRRRIVPQLSGLPYVGHRDLSPSACPGANLYKFVKEKKL